MHNDLRSIIRDVIAGLILLSIPSTIAIVRPFRDAAIAFGMFSVPIWSVVLTIFVIALPLLIRVRRLRKKFAAKEQEFAQMKADIEKETAKREARDAAQKARNSKQRPPRGPGFVRGW
jgi:hypothetical protein